MFERIKSILFKEFRQVFRDPRMRTVIFVAPVIQMLVFGYAATTDVRNIPTAVYDLDNTRESRDIVREFSYSKYFNIKYYIYDDKTQKDYIDKFLVDAVIRFNHGFAKDLEAGKTAQVQLIVDGTDSNTAALILSYANKIIEGYSSRLLEGRNNASLKRIAGFPGVDLKTRAWFNENLESRNFYIPGVIALIVTLISLLLTAMAIVKEKEIGTIEQLIVSPIKPFELILGKLTPFAIIAIMDVIFVTLIGVLWFRIPIRGDPLLLLGATAIYLLTSLGIGLFISTISATQQEAMMSTFLFFFPANLLSGFMFPIANMPKLIQYITYINPLRYYLVILRGIFLKGSGINILWPQMLALFVIGIAVIMMSSLRFHKRLG